MPRVWELVTLTFLGVFTMGNIDSLTSSVMDIGAYGTSTGDAVNLMFFLFVFLVIAVVSKNYFSS
jgi:hypothetical protein